MYCRTLTQQASTILVSLVRLPTHLNHEFNESAVNENITAEATFPVRYMLFMISDIPTATEMTPHKPCSLPETVVLTEHEHNKGTRREDVAAQPKSSDRPASLCPFCGKFKVSLITIHLNTEKSVKNCLKLSLKDRRATVTQLKHTGIIKRNVNLAVQRDAVQQHDQVSSLKTGLSCVMFAGY